MVVVEPTVSLEKLSAILAEGAESEVVDFKREHDPGSRLDDVVLAKEAGAMQMLDLGGYVVLGVNNDGSVSGLLTDAQATQLDESVVRAKLLRYLDEPLELLVAAHKVDDQNVVLIYVGPSRDCFAVFKADGSYAGPDGRERFKFRAGDVFARHGTASERWTQRDLDRVRRRVRDQEKERWREELRGELAQLDAGRDAQALAAGPAANLSWQLDLDAFIATSVELARRDDDIPLRLLLNGLPARVDELITSGQDEQLADILDRIACLLATFMSIGRDVWFSNTLSALVAAYVRAFDVRGIGRTDTRISAPHMWLMIVERVHAVGALAIRTESWQHARDVVVQRGTGYDFEHYTNWLRHALTMAARAHLFTQDINGQQGEVSLIELAHNHIRRLACLRPDADPESDTITSSLCQFDALASFIGVDNANCLDGTHFYPSFARFYSRRTIPIVRRLIEDAELRRIAFPRSDPELAQAIREISHRAEQEGWRFDGFTGFRDDVVGRFLDENPPPPADV